MERGNGAVDQSILSQSNTSIFTLPYEMDSSDKNIDHKVLQDTHTISKEWSVTTSALNLLNSTSSNSHDNIGTLKECCANPSDTLNDKEDFIVLESTASVNISNLNSDDTKYLSMHKPSAFQKRHEPYTNNVSRVFENILQDDSQMEITQDSVCLSHFQKRKRILPEYDEDFNKIINSDNSGIDSAEVSMKTPKLRFSKRNKDQSYFNVSNFDKIISSDNSGMDSAEVSMKTPKRRFSKKSKDQSYFDVPDYNLSTTNTVTVTDYNNVSEIKENEVFKKPNLSLLVNDRSTITMDKSKTESLTNEFTKKSTIAVDSALDNVLNDSITSNSVPNDKMTSLNNTSAESNTSRMHLCNTSYEMHSLNYTYDISVNHNSSKVELLSESTKNKIEQPIDKTYTLESDLTCNKSTYNSLNYTYNVPVSSNSIKVDLLSESTKNNIKLKNISIEQPINETYTLENDPTSNKSTHDMSKSPKNTFSDTFTVGNNSNETRPKSANKTMSTLADMSNIYNQSKSSLRKPNFTCKLPLNIGSQDYNITINDSNTVSDEMDITENNKSTKFKLKKNDYEGNSEIFENIISSSQENEMSSAENINNDVLSNKTNTSTAASSNNLFNISFGSNSKQNIEESMEKSLTQQSNVLLDAVFESNKNISDIPLSHKYQQNIEEPIEDTTLTQPSNVIGDGIFENENDLSEIPFIHKFNKSNSFKRSSYKFNFSKKYGRLSKSHYENSMNFDEKNVSIVNRSPNHCNVDFDSNSQIFKVQEENHNNSQITEQLSVSSPSVLNTLNREVEKINNNLTLTQNTTLTLSQSPGPRFIDKHSINAHSVVFSDLIEHSVNSDTSVNISELVKFKNHKNVSETNSVVFENAIANSQESNTTSTQKITSSHSVLYDQSKIQCDEISIFVNMDEVLSENESLSNSDHLKKKNTDGSLSLEESNCLEVESNILNTTSTNSNLTFSKTKLFKEKDSKMISVNGNNTFNELTASLELDESINNHSLSNITAGLLIENDSSPNIRRLMRSTSKSLLASNISDMSVSNKVDDHTNTLVSNNTPNHFSNISRNSTSISSMDEELVLESDRSQRNQSKRSISSKYSTSSTSHNESLSLNDSLESNESLRNRSKRSKRSMSLTSTNDDLTLSTITIRSLKSNSASINQSVKSVNKSKESTSKPLTVNIRDLSNKSSNLLIQEDNTKNFGRISTHSSKEKSRSSDTVELEILYNNDELLNNEGPTANNITGSLKQKELSIKKSISKPSLTINTKDSSKEKSRSSNTAELEIYNNDELLNNEEPTLNNITGSLKQKELSIKKSISKPSLPINTRDFSKEKSRSSDTAELEISNNELLNNDGLALNNITDSLKQKKLSIKKSISKPSLTINTKDFSKDKSHSSNTTEPEISYYNPDGLQNKNKSTSTRVKRLSSSKKILKHNEVLLSKINMNGMSACSSRSSKGSFSYSNHKNNNEESGDSIFWTTLTDNSTSKSAAYNVSTNEFQTPTNNKLAVAEHIINKIGIMSVNKQKATHPGAFKLEDHVSGSLTRSSVKHTGHNPSCLTRLLAGENNTFESATPSQTFSETIVDESQVKNNIKVKFKSLYNKEPWITKRLYNFLISKLTPKYNIYSMKYAEKFVKYLASILKEVHTAKVDRQMYTDMLRYHLARYGIINDTYDYLGFLTDYIPLPYYEELIPGWDLATSEVVFDPKKYFVPIMDDEEFLNKVLDNLNAA